MAEVDVEIVEAGGTSSVVQFTEGGTLKRVTVLNSQIATVPKQVTVDDTVLDGAPVIGYDFSGAYVWSVTNLEPPFPTTTEAIGDLIEAELNRLGIWTKEDFSNNPTQAQAALRTVFQQEYYKLLAAITEMEIG